MNSSPPQARQASKAFHVMAKPVGPICNLHCQYCFYLEKKLLYPRTRNFRMSQRVLASYVRQYIEAQDAPEVSFAWQGGEPTLAGVDFFARAVELQRTFANGKRIFNALQTNALLLDQRWCEFLKQHNFLVGVSIDGPADLHDRYRLDRSGRPSFEAVMQAVERLKRHAVEFNTLTVVHRDNARRPLEVYHFLKQIGSRFIQFIPLVERRPDRQARAMGLSFAGPPADSRGSRPAVTSWSVQPEQYGQFLIEIFDEWVRHDVGTVSVQVFDVALGNWMGLGSSLCVFAQRCGNALVVEHNGDVYSCDHYVYPGYKLGNLLVDSLDQMFHSPQQERFGNDKFDTLPRYCLDCEVRFACNGECPKHRFAMTPDGQGGLNYLCVAYRRFFHHVDPYMRVMAELARSGRDVAAIMQMVRQQDRPVGWPAAKRNDPCPCGSGRKYKHCCGARPGLYPRLPTSR